jgi:hypothetical protein
MYNSKIILLNNFSYKNHLKSIEIDEMWENLPIHNEVYRPPSGNYCRKLQIWNFCFTMPVSIANEKQSWNIKKILILI